MKRFESIQHVPIQREEVISEMILESEERLKSQEKSIEEAESKRQEIISRIKSACSAFKVTCPNSWKQFEENITTLHALAMMLDRRTPLDMIRHQKEFGVYTDAQQWALEKAFVQGQLEILDSLMNVMSINEADIQKRMLVEREENTLCRKVLTFFKSVVKAKSR